MRQQVHLKIAHNGKKRLMLAISIFVLQNIVQKKKERERCEGVCVGKRMSCVGKRKKGKKESQLNLIGICLIVDEE